MGKDEQAKNPRGCEERELRRERQAACAGEDRTPPRPRYGLSGALVPGGLRYVRRKFSRGGDSHGGWARLGTRGDGSSQRRDRKGRYLLPDDSQETPAGTGDSRAEIPAVYLSRRLRGCFPA